MCAHASAAPSAVDTADLWTLVGLACASGGYAMMLTLGGEGRSSDSEREREVVAGLTSLRLHGVTTGTPCSTWAARTRKILPTATERVTRCTSNRVRWYRI